jgi:molecular chaperone GrpE
MTDEPKDETNPPADDACVPDAASETPEEPDSTASPAELQTQVGELQDQLLRSQAELENFRRRSQREAGESRKYQSLAIVRDLLPSLDNLQRAIQAAEQSGDIANLLEGIRMVSQHLADTLKRHAAELIAAEGKVFDPNLHEALSQVPTPDHPPMTVIQVVEDGYKMHDRVVRPAKVIVSCAAPNADEASEEGE